MFYGPLFRESLLCEIDPTGMSGLCQVGAVVSGALLESEAYFLLPVHGWMRRSVILQLLSCGRYSVI